MKGEDAATRVMAPANRREFLLQVAKIGGLSAASVGVGAWLKGRSARPVEAAAAVLKKRHFVAPVPSLPEIVVTRGESPRALVRSAVEGLGGIGRFVQRGDVVVVKPNVGWDRPPDMAATTNPDVVAEVVRLCREAGAGQVIVTDVSCNDARASFERSGIASAAKQAGATVILPDPLRFKTADLGGDVLTEWPVLEPFLTADKIINVAIAKHHSLTGVTLGMKNWYGIIGGQRNRLHQRIHESLADLTAFVTPTLTIIDAYRVLMRNGPTGGSLADVETRKSLVASADPVAADAYAAKTFFDLEPQQLAFLRIGEARKLGTMVVDQARVAERAV
jgi:uncharacterized protein (DUF362 family)